jgi:hypothetical protein
LDGCSRFIINWDLREPMTEADIEILFGAGQAGTGAETQGDHRLR